MKHLLPVLLVAGLALAQIFGPAGIPLSWDFGIEYFKSDSISASKFTSPSATSYQYFSSSAAADSLVWVQTQAAGDNDMVIKFVEDDGTVRNFRWDDALAAFMFDERIYAVGTKRIGVYGGSNSQIMLEIDGTGNLWTNTIGMMLDPNLSGAGTLQLGVTGDKDITLINSRLTTTITTVDTTTVMGAADGYMFTMTAADTLKCPVTPLAGEVLECKFTNASGGLLFGNGRNIDGASEVAASENDNIRIVYNATSGEWEIR